MGEDKKTAPPPARESIEELSDRPQAFYNALLTEHFVLESARGITVSESSSRASVYLMTLSSSLVAFGFLAQTPFAYGFLGVMIPVIVILGFFTYERLIQTSLEDIAALNSIQRIRRYYSQLLPGAGEFFPAPHGKHALNELLDIGTRGSWRGVFFTMSTAIAVVNSIVAGAGVSVVSAAFGLAEPGAVVAGLGFGLVLGVLHALYQIRQYDRMIRIIVSGHRPAR
jgi:hypothetical protein